ncbi:MAG: hypothetical protein ACTHNQ_06120, partial [Microbacterium sp.]
MSTAAGPQTPPPTPGADEPASPPPGPARRGVRGTWVDLVRTMLVVLAFVALIVLLVPRPGELPRPAVDAPAAATAAAS